MSLYGIIEAGGTKFVCAVAESADKIHSRVEFPTTTPDETLAIVANYFSDFMKNSGEKLDSIGIACFGPLDLNKNSDKYGYITSTPKPGWQYVDVAGFFKRKFNLPVGFDTDVNAAAYSEFLWGAGKQLDVVLYLTVGTGIGGGLYVNGKPLHGLMHPEMGHVIVNQDKEKDPFDCICPYHTNCLEGLASGKAVDMRWKCHASELDDDHQAWEIEADYLAQGIMNYILVASPQIVILGGGLMHKKLLYRMIREKVQQKLNGYINISSITDNIDKYIVEPGLGVNAGIDRGFCLTMLRGFTYNEPL